MDITVTIISSLLSGIVGVGISTWYYRRHEKRKQQFEVLRKIAGTRFTLINNVNVMDSMPEVTVQFFSALNEIVVLFNESPDVIKALKNMHGNLGNPTVIENDLVTLYKEMCKVLNIKNNDLNDQFFLKPFSPFPSRKK